MTRALIAKLAAGAIVAAGGAVAVVLLTSGSNAVAGPASAWIDEPLNGSSAPLGAIPVMAHASDATGIAAMEFAVDDTVLATQEVSGSPVFWLATFDWSADEPGSAVIRVRARNTGGQWGTPAFAIVYVGGRGPSSTPTPSETTPTTAPSSTAPHTTPPSTAPPTTPPACRTLVPPDLATPQDGAAVGTLSPTLDWRYAGPCTPGGFLVQVSSARDFSAIDRSGNTGGSITEWTVSPALVDCRSYYWRVRAFTGETSGSWSSTYRFDVRVGRC